MTYEEQEKQPSKKYSRILMVALFATGISGIVAEYILATLATYFLGDSTFQWTMVLSFMLFSMGLGARVSKLFAKHEILIFIRVELVLSILTSFSALIVYMIMPYLRDLSLLIYGLSILIGLLIGMEIPLVTRINAEFKTLSTNISSVMEKDYYGSLVGGIFFAFIGIPFLGLTYTPFIVGGINFVIALLVLIQFRTILPNKKRINGTLVSLLTGVIMLLGLIFAQPIVLFGNQSRFDEKVIFTEQTKYQQITITQWREHYWLYLNQGKQLSTFDEWMYHEPLVHPVMMLNPEHQHVLVMGAGDGCAVREILKYPRVEQVTVVDLDPRMTDIGKNHPIFRNINQDAFHSQKVKIINADAFTFLEETNQFYDVIIADFPDPRTIELNRLYTQEMYRLVHHRLRPRGVFITQATSPYYTTKTFHGIDKTVAAAGFNTIPIHNHVYTFGEWGWIIGTKSLSSEKAKELLRHQKFDPEMELKFLTQDAMYLITSFGQDLVKVNKEELEVNKINNPILYRYYSDGNWSYYF